MVLISAIVVDDEAPAREELKYLLEKEGQVRVVGEATDGLEALELIKEKRPQVVFLDIQMPELDGFGLAELLVKLENPPLIVFATAFDQYAVKAFEHAALDYLLKPVNQGRVEQTIKRIKALLFTPQETIWKNHLREFLDNLKRPAKIDRLPVLENEKVVLLRPEEILYVEGQGRGTQIVTGSRTYSSNYSLNELEAKLKDHHFFRTHKSFLVNLNEIREVIPWFNNTLLLHLKGSSMEIPVSRTYLREFKQRISL